MAESFSRWKSTLVKKAVPFVTAAIGFFWYRNKLQDFLFIHQNLYDQHPDSIMTSDSQGRIIAVNEQAVQMTGFTKEDLQGKSIYTLFSFKKVGLLEGWIKNPVTGSMKDLEGRMLTKAGTYRDVNISIIKSLHNQREPAIHLIIEDITSKKRQEDHIKFLAYHDELTSLPNRRILTMLIGHMIKKNQSFCIMLVDFDGFKQVNDRFGHSVGDQFLRKIANRLIKLSEGRAIVGRLGGDEFLVIFPASECDEHARKMIDGFSEPFAVEKITARLTASGGIASYPDQAQNSKELLEYADKAMYQMKRSGGNGYCYFSN